MKREFGVTVALASSLVFAGIASGQDGIITTGPPQGQNRPLEGRDPSRSPSQKALDSLRLFATQNALVNISIKNRDELSANLQLTEKEQSRFDRMIANAAETRRLYDENLRHALADGAADSEIKAIAEDGIESERNAAKLLFEWIEKDLSKDQLEIWVKVLAKYERVNSILLHPIVWKHLDISQTQVKRMLPIFREKEKMRVAYFKRNPRPERISKEFSLAQLELDAKIYDVLRPEQTTQTLRLLGMIRSNDDVGDFLQETHPEILELFIKTSPTLRLEWERSKATGE